MINKETINNSYVPKTALMVYQLKSESLGFSFEEDEQSPEFYIEQHLLYHTRQGTYKLGTGSPLELNTIRKISEAVSDGHAVKRKFEGMMPKKLISFYPHHPNETLIWVVEAKRRELKFSRNDFSSGEVNCPKMIFKVCDNSRLNVYVVKDKEVTPDTVLYNAPFPNVTGASVCIGGAIGWVKDTETYDELMNQWETIFFDSNFNHDGGKEQAEISMEELWKPLINTRKKFPSKNLKKSNSRLKDIIR